MKIAIIYESFHHGNTKKLVSAITQKYHVELINAEKAENINLNKYDLIGFASGIAFGKFYKKVQNILKEHLPPEKNVFFIYTCGNNSKDFSLYLQEIVKKRGGCVLGSYGCKGFDTYGPFKLIGGINKERPNERDINKCIEFFERVMKKI